MKRIKKYIGVALLGSLAMAFPSCSDTWDEHYGTDNETGETAATESLWDIISHTPNLSRFKAIAEKAYYYRDELHPQKDPNNPEKNYTFKDMLSGTATMTVWAPEDDAFTEESFQRWMNMAEAGGSQGFTVQQQLLGNSIALWRHVATGGTIDTLTMLNGKKKIFDKKQFTMQGLTLEQKNIPATNGTLHTVKDTVPFIYNLYEYLRDEANAKANGFSKFHEFVLANDTSYFDENQSIEGAPDIDGNPTYVDSVYISTNRLFFGTHRFPTQTDTEKYLVYDEGIGANIVSEDSTFIMLMPTDAAWEAAYQKLEPYYNYATKYLDMSKYESATNGKTTDAMYMPLGGGEINQDSLKNKNITMDIASPLCFNLHQQPNAEGRIGTWKLDAFLADGGSTPKYLLNTFGDTLRTDTSWNKGSLLSGSQLSVSNGVGIIKTEWDIPAKLHKPDIIIEVNRGSFYNQDNTGTETYTPFSNVSASKWIDDYGRVSHDNFYYLQPKSATSAPVFSFKLYGNEGENRESEVMSGTYDVYVVMVPNFYLTSTDSIEFTTTEGGSAVVISDKKAENYGDTVPAKHMITGTIYHRGLNKNGKETEISTKGSTVSYDGTSVQAIKVFENFKFPFSYKNIIRSYPILTLDFKTTSTDRNNGYSNFICIDRIILRSKD